MPWGHNRTASRKHASQVHECPCGRTINGNAFGGHKYKCPAWLEAESARTGQTVQRLLDNDESYRTGISVNEIRAARLGITEGPCTGCREALEFRPRDSDAFSDGIRGFVHAATGKRFCASRPGRLATVELPPEPGTLAAE